MIRELVRDTLAKSPRLDGLFRRQLWSRIHFPEAELRALDALAPGRIDTAVDVGAALGSYAWVLGRKSKRVISYEPGSVHGAYMGAATRGTNVTLVPVAVGAEPGELEMFTPGNDNDARHMATLSAANPVIRAAGTSSRRVPVVSLDSDLPGRLAVGASVDVIKIDVEGFENAVLAGAITIIATHHPLIIAEIEARHNPDHGVAFDQLRAAGYIVSYWRDGHYHRLDGNDIAALQRPEDLDLRLGAGHVGAHNRYINNFVFQHPLSRISLA